MLLFLSFETQGGWLLPGILLGSFVKITMSPYNGEGPLLQE